MKQMKKDKNVENMLDEKETVKINISDNISTGVQNESLQVNTNQSETLSDNSIIYKVFSAYLDEINGNEYYSATPPKIVNDYIVMDNYFEKNTVKLSVSGINKEIGFKKKYEENTEKNIRIPLIPGIIMNITKKGEILEWFTKTKEKAESELKDLELSEYRKLFPTLIQEINNLKQQKIQTHNKGLIDF